MTDGLRKSHLRKVHQVGLSEVGLPEGNHMSKLFCKRLPSHTGQGQACTRITWLFVRSFVCLFVTMPKMAQYTGKWLLPAP